MKPTLWQIATEESLEVQDGQIRGVNRLFQCRQERDEMSISERIKSNIAYGQELIESGVEGAKEARKATRESPDTTDLVADAAQESWQGATIGVLAGAIFGVLTDDRKPLRGVITGGLLGAVAGFAGTFAWKTRPITSSMVHGASKRIGTVRNQHWLDKNPINYG